MARRTLEEMEGVVELQQLEGRARAIPLLLGLAVVDIL
jgi:hypothetical protein